MQRGQSSALLLLGWSLLLWICVGSWVQVAAARGCQGPPLPSRRVGSSCRAVFSSWHASPDVAPSVLPREICRAWCCSREVRRARVRGLQLPARLRAPQAGGCHVSPRAHRNPGATAGTCSSRVHPSHPCSSPSGPPSGCLPPQAACIAFFWHCGGFPRCCSRLMNPAGELGSRTFTACDSCAGFGWFYSRARGNRSFFRACVGFWACSSTALGKKKPKELSGGAALHPCERSWDLWLLPLQGLLPNT